MTSQDETRTRPGSNGPSLAFSGTAAAVLRDLLERRATEGRAIRLEVDRGGSGEPEVAIRVTRTTSPDDRPVDAEGVTVFVAPEVSALLGPVTLDARRTAFGPRFLVQRAGH